MNVDGWTMSLGSEIVCMAYPGGVGGVGSVVLADRAKCAKITDLFKQSAGGDEDTGEKADTSAWCAGSRCFVMLTCYVL